MGYATSQCINGVRMEWEDASRDDNSDLCIFRNEDYSTREEGESPLVVSTVGERAEVR